MSLLRFSRTVSLAVVMLLPGILRASPAPAPAQSHVKFQWLTNYNLATAEARKSDKLILLYFSGSDWDPWTDKLEKDVLSTDPFKTWANEHIIPMQVDFAKEKRINSITKAQNDKLKTQYSVAKVPLFVFVDATGAPMARASYEDLRLRDEEVKGHPNAAIAFLDNLLKNRPKDEVLKSQPDFLQGRLFAKKNYAVLVMAITQGNAPYWTEQRDALFKDQQFVRFMNHNAIFLNMNWPEDTDMSASAKDFRVFADRLKLLPSPFQIVLWDVPYDKIKAKYKSFSLQHVDQLVKNIQLQLPHVDYSGGWITDFNLARTIAAQTDRDIFMAFTSMDGGEWSKKWDDELFKSEQFLAYAHKHFVLLRIDFPTTTTQPAALSNQNKMLAELFSIKGYPMVVVMNPKGEKLLESKYMRDGPTYFMKQLTPIVEKDADRLAALKEQD
jgi:thioredoxin-related protein